MGYEAVNFNANLFEIPQLYCSIDSSCAISAIPNSIFGVQASQTPYYDSTVFFDFNFENIGNFSMQPNYNFGSLNSFMNIPINPYNYLGSAYYGLNLPTLNYGNNIFSGKVPGLAQINTSATTAKNVKRDGLGAAIAAKASSFIGKVNNDAEGNRLFSGGKNQAWCQDFVSWNLGAVTDKLPKTMTTTSSPIAFRDKAISLGCYQKVLSSDRINWAKNNIHKGDVIVKSGKGQSGLHVAIVLDVKDDGTIVAVSGNSGNAVKRNNYNINKGDIYGVVDIEKAANLA